MKSEPPLSTQGSSESAYMAIKRSPLHSQSKRSPAPSLQQSKLQLRLACVHR